MLDVFAAEVREELFSSLDEYLGQNTDTWTEIDLSKTLRAVIARTSSRFTVGSTLCTFDVSPSPCFGSVVLTKLQAETRNI